MAADCAAEIKCPQRGVAFGLDFHPSERLLAAGLITGQLRVYSFGDNGAQPERQLAARPHSEACRSVRFDPQGRHIISCGSDCSVQRRDVAANKPVWKTSRAHASAINVCEPLGPNGVGTGDDDGVVHVWDVRQKGSVMSFSEHADVIQDLHFSLAKLQLACCSSDGHLSVYDLRKGRLEARSDELEEELLSMASLKGGKKLVVGCASGVVGIFSWGHFGDFSDRLTPLLLGSTDAIEAIAPLGEHAMLIGSADGGLRAVALHPSRLIAEVGRHPEPVEALAVDGGATVAATSALDGLVRLWDVRGVADGRGRRGASNGGDSLPGHSQGGLEAGSDDEAGVGDREEEEEVAVPQKKRKQANSGKGGRAKGPIRIESGFFADL